MATEDKRIDQLQAVTSPDLTSLLAMQQGTEAKKVTLQQLLDYLNGLVDAGNAVLFVAQTLTDEQKLQARTNIGAAAPGEGDGGGSAANAVLYVAQTLTEEQQNQARQNIRCGSVGETNSYAQVGEAKYNHAEGYNCRATGPSYIMGAHAEGTETQALARGAHSEGIGTISSSIGQHVQGTLNIEDADGKYAHIVGNGANSTERSNAHTLDWAGVPWFAGDRVMLGGTGMDDENAVALMPIFVAQTLTDAQKLQARTNIGAIGADDLTTEVEEALTAAKESGEFDGAPGYTPVRGTDYWTAADIAEIKSYVDDAILGGEW